MRIPDLRKKIITNFSIAFILLIFAIGIINFYLTQESVVTTVVKKINGEIDQIKNETASLESKSAEIAKYTEIWQNLSENKTVATGIKIDDFNAKLSSTAAKHSISNVNLKISLPEAFKDGIFKRDTVDVMLSTVNMTFIALNDIKALAFVNELVTSIQGYPVITFFELRKAKDYSAEDFKNMAAGKEVGIVSAKIDFSWYIYKDLVTATAPAILPVTNLKQVKN